MLPISEAKVALWSLLQSNLLKYLALMEQLRLIKNTLIYIGLYVYLLGRHHICETICWFVAGSQTTALSCGSTGCTFFVQSECIQVNSDPSTRTTTDSWNWKDTLQTCTYQNSLPTPLFAAALVFIFYFNIHRVNSVYNAQQYFAQLHTIIHAATS